MRPGGLVLVRSITAAESERVATFLADPPLDWINAERFREDWETRQYRPEWTWTAEDPDGELVGRALWWGRTDGELPVALDCLHVREGVPDRAAVAVALLEAGHRAFRERGAERDPLYNLALPRGWRGDAGTASAVEWRRLAAHRAGLTDEVERLRYEWTPQAGLPAAGTRLTFAPADDAAFLDAFRRLAQGSLDVRTGRELAANDADVQAREDMQFYLDAPGERDWWRLAYTAEGMLAGLAVPSSTGGDNRNVGYLGVVPELRGRGLIDEILAHITRFQAAAGAERITATTDTVNLPMAAAFDRAGYEVTEIRLVLEQPPKP
jgi:RimJ/RimL family protein N-acetyltransferase